MPSDSVTTNSFAVLLIHPEWFNNQDENIDISYPVFQGDILVQQNIDLLWILSSVIVRSNRSDYKDNDLSVILLFGKMSISLSNEIDI